MISPIHSRANLGSRMVLAASLQDKKHRNVFEAASATSSYERDKDIFGVQCGKVWSMGLVDAGSSELGA